MSNAYDIVMKNRKELVDKIIQQMEKGYSPTQAPWQKVNICHYNPSTGAIYRGGNQLRLKIAAFENNYSDPRWMTFKQAAADNLKIKAGSKGVLLEKWIFSKEVDLLDEYGKPILDSNGHRIKTQQELKSPIVNYFRVFNGSQIEGLPDFVPKPVPTNNEISKIAENFEKSSRCPIYHESLQDRAFYSPKEDAIHLPSVERFKSSETHLSVLLHEMAHSTGHESCLNRDIQNKFGTPDYAKEELNAEFSSYFIQGDLGLSLEADETLLKDHANYIRSWISVFKNDPNELFRACANADKISSYLMKNYELQIENVRQNTQTSRNNQENSINPSEKLPDADYHASLQQQMRKNGLKPNQDILSCIDKLNSLTMKQHSLKDIESLYKEKTLSSDNPEVTKLVNEIGDILKQQQLQMRMDMTLEL